MKKLFLTLALVTCVFTSAFAQTAKPKTATPNRNVSLRLTPLATAPAGAAYSSLTTAWTYSSNAPACPTTGVLSNCYNGFTVTISQGSTVVFSAQGGQGTGLLGPTATSVSWTPAAGVPFGSYSTTVVAVGYDLNGAALTSPPATATLTVGLTTLNPPTGVTLTGK